MREYQRLWNHVRVPAATNYTRVLLLLRINVQLQMGAFQCICTLLLRSLRRGNMAKMTIRLVGLQIAQSLARRCFRHWTMETNGTWTWWCRLTDTHKVEDILLALALRPEPLLIEKLWLLVSVRITYLIEIDFRDRTATLNWSTHAHCFSTAGYTVSQTYHGTALSQSQTTTNILLSHCFCYIV